MDTATKLLITGGVVLLFYAFLVGFALGRVRSKAPSAPRHLVLTHTGSIMQAAALLGLSLALQLSNLSNGLETTLAVLLVAGAALIAIGDTVNWLSGTEDPFAQKSAGFRLQGVGSTVEITGLAILLVGVIKGL